MADVNALFSNIKPVDPTEQASKAIGLAQQAQTLDTSKFELALKQLGVLRNVTASFLADPDAGKTDVTKKVQSEISKLVGMGLYTPQQATQFLKGFPSDPTEQYKSFIKTHAETLSASEQLQAIFGAPTDTDTGTGTLTTQRPSYPGLPVRERGFVRSGLPPTTTTPNETTQQPEYLGGNEAPAVEQRPGSLSQLPGGRPARPGSLLPVAPRQPPAMSGPPGAPSAPAQAPQAAATPPAAASSARVPAAFPLGTETSTKVAVEDLSNERNEAGNYQDRVNPTRGMIGLLDKASDKDVGPGSDKWNTIMSGLQTWGLGEIAGVDPRKIADFEKLKKYMADAASRRAQGLGPHTNDGLAAAVSASPNTKLSRLGASELAKVNLALDRMRQARVLEFDDLVQKRVLPENRWGTWKAKWGTDIDPRAFIYDLMDEKAQAKLEKDMTKEQREKFERSLALADKWRLMGDVH